MNRRIFIQTAAAASTLLLLGAEGCQSRLAALTAALGHGVAALAAALGHNDWADKLRRDTDAVLAAISKWKPGMAAVDIVHLLNDLIRDITRLDVLEKFRPLVTFALGTAASIVAFLNQNSGGNTPPDTPVRLTLPPYNAREFNHNWDAIRAGSPDMQQAPIL